MLLDERRPDGPAAEGLPSQGPRAGEEIDGVLSADGRAKEVENRFADAVFHRTRAGVAGVVDLAAAKVSADDPHSRRLRPARRRFAAAALSFAHVHDSTVCQMPVDMLPYGRRGEGLRLSRFSLLRNIKAGTVPIFVPRKRDSPLATDKEFHDEKLFLTHGGDFGVLLAPAMALGEEKPAAKEKDAAAAQDRPQLAKFRQASDAWKQLHGDLLTLQSQYRSADAAQRREIHKKWDELFAKAPAMQDQLIAAAKAAYVEAPNANENVVTCC